MEKNSSYSFMSLTPWNLKLMLENGAGFKLKLRLESRTSHREFQLVQLNIKHTSERPTVQRSGYSMLNTQMHSLIGTNFCPLFFLSISPHNYIQSPQSTVNNKENVESGVTHPLKYMTIWKSEN